MPEQSPFGQYRAEIHYFDQSGALVHITKMPNPWPERVVEEMVAPDVKEEPQAPTEQVDIQAIINPKPALPKKQASPSGPTVSDVAMATPAQEKEMYLLAVKKKGLKKADEGLAKMKAKPVTYQLAVQIIHDLKQLPDFVDPEMAKQ